MVRRHIAILLSAAMIVSTAVSTSVFADELELSTVSVLEEETSEINETNEETESGEENGFDIAESVVEESEEAEAEESQETEKHETGEAGTEEDIPEGTEEEVQEGPAVKAVLSENEKTITLTATGLDPTASVVYFPVWSTIKDQDDLEWISGKKQEDGSWTASVSVKKHKDLGEYNIHCYQTVDGKQTFVGKTTVTVSVPTATVEIEDLNAENGTFTVRIKDFVVPSGVTKVEVPVWGEISDQNDLVWYQAVKDGDDYIVKVDAAQHAYENGLYHVHVYITDGNGIRTCVKEETTELKMENGVKAVLSDDETSITVTARGINSSATAVRFPVWSENNNQDDLKWVSATKVASGIWTATILVKDHKDYGKYLIHCYQTVKGSQKFFGESSVTITKPSGTISTTTPDESSGAFQASISDLVIPAGVKQIQFAVWGSDGDQNDLVWHTASKQGDKYVANISPSEHKFETGTYNVHCYVTDMNGIFVCAGTTEVTVNLKEGVSAVVAADQKTVKIQYIGSKASQSLKVAVWSAKGDQDDLIWYSMKQNGNGAAATVTVSKHKTAGTYYAHVYTSGNKKVGETTFTIDAMGNATVKVSSINGTKGTFKVTVSDLSTPSGLEKVMIPVWPNGDQSKIYWYTATKSGDNYVCTVDVSKHSLAFGHYDVHVYGYANNGVWGFAGSSSAELNADKYIYTEKTGTYTTRVWILNAGEDATGVSFKAWSNNNGTDDVVTYSGTKSGSNNYYADILSKKHKNGGNYTTEVYVKNASGSSLVGTASFSMAKEGEAKNQQMFEYAQGFSSDTEYLILVNRALHRVAIYQGSKNNWKEIKYWPCVVGKPSTPTPTGTFKIKGRFNYFGDGHLCWWCTQIEGYYYFHTVLYYTDTAPIKVLDGTMDAAASAGCIRLEEPNARFIYTTIPRGTTVHIYN